MPRSAGYAPGGFVYHALHRAIARLPLLEKDGDDPAFERVPATWPLPEPADWLKHISAAPTEAELAAPGRSVTRGTPFGSAAWMNRTARRLATGIDLTPKGRPKKAENPAE